MEKKKESKEVKVRSLLSSVSARGRKFQGTVIRKFEKRVTIEFERVNYVKKYERYSKSKAKIHAYLPASMVKEINLGDYIQVQECRPLSKIIHHIVIKKIRAANQTMEEGK
ncbi:MAG: 30S ribosomal protein S17 [Nanoarchaeota archaeon]|nr:30S ribosomal protein S17 [Nanoarchaeota archaeon]